MVIFLVQPKIFAAQNPPNIVWRLGSAHICWGSLQRSPDPLGPILLRGRGKSQGGEGGNREGLYRERRSGRKGVEGECRGWE